MSRLLFFILLFSLGCNPIKNLQTDNWVISMETTSCFGPCPIFEIKIYSNRIVTLNAKENLDLKGNFYSRITQNQLEEFRTHFIESDFFALEDIYKSPATDLPTVYIGFRDQNRTKLITDYDNSPEELDMLEDEIKRLIETLDWKEAD